MSTACNPTADGVPHRIGALDSALTYILRHEGVWCATGSEIIEYYLPQVRRSEHCRHRNTMEYRRILRLLSTLVAARNALISDILWLKLVPFMSDSK